MLHVSCCTFVLLLYMSSRFALNLKTIRTPNQNSSYGIEGGGSYAICLGPHAIFSVKIAWFEGTLMPSGPLLYDIFWGHMCFASMGGGGWSELFSKVGIHWRDTCVNVRRSKVCRVSLRGVTPKGGFVKGGLAIVPLPPFSGSATCFCPS